MNGIDTGTLDEVLAKTFRELKTAIEMYNEKGIEVYSSALTALVRLRESITAEAGAGS